jgi:hypothetical protein
MRFVSNIVFLFLFSTLSGWAQSRPADVSEAISPSKYLLTAYLSTGEVIVPTGRIVKTIALSHPRSMEIANIYVNYKVNIRLKTDPAGESVAVVTFLNLKMTGALDYKGFDISDHIFPSLVSFRLLEPGTSTVSVSSSNILAAVKGANVNNGDCSVTVSLHKKITDSPVIDQIAFYHSDEDFIRADSQMKLIDRYYAASWLSQRADKLLDALQTSCLHNPSKFLAVELEQVIINDWLTRQHFNRYPLFQKKDTMSLIRTLEVNRFRKKLIDQDFIIANIISNEDLVKASKLFADNLAVYFDSNQPDFNRETYLSQMAESRLSTIGYNAIHDFADSYTAYHKLPKIDGLFFERAATLIRTALTEKASQLADKEQYSEAMNMLNASDKYNLEPGVMRSQVESVLIGKLTQRLYSAYLDFALKSLNTGIYTITTDFYQKAIQLKQTYKGLILTDSRERYLADMICRLMLTAAEKSLKSNDVQTALATYEQIIHMAETARLKENYETARTRMETLSNRPSGYKHWEGEDLAIEIPVGDIEKIKASANSAKEMNRQIDNDTISTASSRRLRARLIAQMKVGKKGLSRQQLKALKESLTRSEKALANKKTKKGKRQSQQSDSLQSGTSTKVVIVKVNDTRQKVLDNIQAIHLKIWTGDTLSSALLLDKTDSLQQILTLTGDKTLETDIRALHIILDEKRCELQKDSYQRELDLIRKQTESKDFVYAAKQLRSLIDKPYPATCKISKSDAIQLLSSLEIPLNYARLLSQLDTIAQTREPSEIITAFEQLQDYYRINLSEKSGVNPPDLMTLLKSRKETAFLLQGVSAMLETHRPAYALELMKEINKLEPKPDVTNSLQKRLGEMLASGDHSEAKTSTEMLNAYNVNDKWYKELVTAYKKQWKLLSK